MSLVEVSLEVIFWESGAILFMRFWYSSKFINIHELRYLSIWISKLHVHIVNTNMLLSISWPIASTIVAFWHMCRPSFVILVMEKNHQGNSKKSTSTDVSHLVQDYSFGSIHDGQGDNANIVRLVYERGCKDMRTLEYTLDCPSAIPVYSAS